MSVCGRCGGKPFYTRRYSGETHCAACFRDSIADKAKRTVSKYGMFGTHDRIAVAVSGGKDSLSLLKVLGELYLPRRNEIVAISVDEGVAGYRDEALQHARAVAKELDVEM